MIAQLPLGITAGLLIGKALGILLFSRVAVTFKAAKLPTGIRWRELHGMATLCGVGFTMSFFVASLAFEGGSESLIQHSRLGILVGSFLSSLLGFGILKFWLRDRGEANM